MFQIENLKIKGDVSIGQTPETTSNNKFDYSFFNPNNDINCDGVIDYFKQGQTGDCYLLAALESMANTPEGRDYIKQSVKKHFWGDTTVYFKGIDKTYIITQDELQNASNLSSGDDDVKAFEIAMSKYRTELLEQKEELLSKEHSSFDRLLNYKKSLKINTGKGKIDDPLKAGTAGDFIYLMTGKKATTLLSDDLKDYKCLSDIANPELSPMNISFKNDVNSWIVSDHTYAVLSSNEDETVLVNPWDNSKQIKLPTSFVLKNIETLQYTNLGSDFTDINKKEIKASSVMFM